MRSLADIELSAHIGPRRARNFVQRNAGVGAVFCEPQWSGTQAAMAMPPTERCAVWLNLLRTRCVVYGQA